MPSSPPALYHRDVEEPQSIRKSLATFRSPSGFVPSAGETVQCNSTIVTNWVALYRDVAFAGARLRLHVPVGCGDCGETAPFRNVLVVFKADQERVAVIASRRGVDVSALGKQNGHVLGPGLL